MLISVTTVIRNTEDIIESVIAEIIQELHNKFEYYEILIIDNGSTDGSVSVIRQLQEKVPHIRLLVLSRQYDKEIAFAAALDNSIGDYVVLMDSECDPPTLLPALISEAITKSLDVVIAVRSDRSDNGFLQKLFSPLFYKLYGSISGFYFAPNASYFRVLSRRSVNSITQIKNKSRYLKYFNALVGFSQGSITYNREYRRSSHRQRESFFVLFSRAVDFMISNSMAPLRFVTVVAVFASFLNLLYIAYVFLVTLIKNEIAEGWISTSLVNSSMFFLLFLVLTVLSEYVARVLNETKDQPLYFISDEYNSSFLKSLQDKKNVV